MLGHAVQRFLVPQSLLIFSVTIGMLIDTNPNLPKSLLQHITSPTLPSAIFALLVGGSLPFSLGFIIANLSTFIMRLSALILCCPKGFSTWWDTKSQAKLNKKYDISCFKKEGEQCEQCFLDELGMQHVNDWMRRRWEYFAINLNSGIALILAMIFVSVLNVQPKWPWFVTVSAVSFVFFFNSFQAWKEVIDMDSFLVRNYLHKIDRQGALTPNQDKFSSNQQLKNGGQ